jgi:plasmid stability protein
MPTTLHLRDVPDDLHERLRARAERRGMSLRGYVLSVLADHASLPTLDEWLDGLARVPPAAAATSGAEAVRAAREAEDEDILAAVTGR